MALRRAKTIGANSCQIFVKSNMRWLGKPHDPEGLLLYAKELVDKSVTKVFGHTGYLINLAAPECEKRKRSLESLVHELELAEVLGLPFLVMHPGAHLGAGEEEGIRRIVEGLDEVFATTAKLKVRVALENTAGQGSCLGHKIAHLGQIFERVKKPARLGVCLDTAHFFAAGYELRTQSGWKQAIGEVDSCVGIKQILGFHLNDSKTDLGSRVDRHAHIGEGYLGKVAFQHVLNDERFAEHPACLETFKSDDLHEDIKNLSVLRGLIQKKPSRGKKNSGSVSRKPAKRSVITKD
jgi:deoxyribonuclease-4